MEAKTQPQQILALRIAYVNWLKAMDYPNIEGIAPEPDPNAQDPQQQMMAAQLAAEMEMKMKDQELRQSGQRLQEQKLEMEKQRTAMEAAKTMSELGLKADKQEAEITNLYTQSLERIVKAGIASGQDAMEAAQQIEDRFINKAEGGNSGRNERQIPASIPGPGGPMASGPSDTGVPNLP